jgi:hypothetical protein
LVRNTAQECPGADGVRVGEIGSLGPLIFCRFQDRQVVGANLRLASESPLLVQARRIALGDRTPVVLRVVADTWCRHALDGLHRAGRVVRPLRDAAERTRAAARAAAALEEGDAEERLTTSFVSSTDSDAGSGSTADSDSEP